MEGPAMIRHSSRTLIPARICGLVVWDGVWWKGTGGEEVSRVVTVHGGSEVSIFPFTQLDACNKSEMCNIHVQSL